jgi:peptide chain release factor subunit 3
VVNIYNGKEDPVAFAHPGENIKIRLYGIEDLDLISRGDVLCPREQLMPASETLECEMEVLELLESKPIMSKGYQCVIHLHTVAEEVTLKEILKSWEKDSKGETVEKEKPKYVKSGAKITCRIQVRIPIAVEKFSVVP